MSQLQVAPGSLDERARPRTTAEWQREMMSFVAIRLEKDGDAVREMMGCRNLADVAAIQSRWAEETLRDYNGEVSKLMSIYGASIKGGDGPKRS